MTGTSIDAALTEVFLSSCEQTMHCRHAITKEKQNIFPFVHLMQAIFSPSLVYFIISSGPSLY